MAYLMVGPCIVRPCNACISSTLWLTLYSRDEVLHHGSVAQDPEWLPRVSSVLHACEVHGQQYA